MQLIFLRGGGVTFCLKQEIYDVFPLFFKILFCNLKKNQKCHLIAFIEHKSSNAFTPGHKNLIHLFKQKNSHDEALPISQMNIAEMSRKRDCIAMLFIYFAVIS